MVVIIDGTAPMKTLTNNPIINAMKTSPESLQAILAQKLEQYFNMRKPITTASDAERRRIEIASGKLFAELVELGARAYRTGSH